MFMKHYAPNRCEPSIEVIMKMGVKWGGQGGCKRRIEAIVKIQKKVFGGGGGEGQGGCKRRIEKLMSL